MYSTSSGRGFLPLVTAAHEISPTCSCMSNPGEEECMIHIRAYPRITFSGVANFDAESKIQVSTRERQKFQYHSGQVKKTAPNE